MRTPEELDALQERLLSRDKSRHGYSGHPLYNRDGPEAAEAITALRARVAELEAQAAEAELARRGQVQVNIVWEDLDGYAWRATAPLFGSFRVERYSNGPWQALWSVPGYCAAFVDGGFATAEDAKQAIEARIRAALVSPGDGWVADLNAKIRADVAAMAAERGVTPAELLATAAKNLAALRAAPPASEGADHG